MIRFLHAYLPTRTFVLGFSELCLVAVSFVTATVLRLGLGDAAVMLEYEQGLAKILILSCAFLLCMYYFDLYDSSVLRNRREVLTRMVQALGLLSILLGVCSYFYPPLKLGRGILLIGSVLVAITLIFWRGLFLELNRRPQFAERTMIFGDEPRASALLKELQSRPELGLRVLGRLMVAGPGHYALDWEDPTLSSPNGHITDGELSKTMETFRVTRVIIALDDRRGRLPVDLLLAMKTRGISIQDGAGCYEEVTGKIQLESLRLGSLLFSSGFQLSRPLVIYKRLASLAISVVGLTLSLPLLPLVALAIKLTSPGRLFYHQKRVGKDGSVFDCYKLRTMRAEAEADSGPTWAGDSDPRITTVGRFLRTSRLDEIPQLWNVLKGDMSLVGPRPERPEFVEWLEREIPHYQLRHSVRPGITGWAQTRYKYGNTLEDTKEKLRYDLFYIKHMSPGLDALILFDTVKTILLRRGAK